MGTICTAQFDSASAANESVLPANACVYRPTRFEAQVDAINLIHSAKTQANPESSVGLMSMGGNGPEVLVTLTADIGKILDGLHRTKTQGNSHLGSSIQVAHVS